MSVDVQEFPYSFVVVRGDGGARSESAPDLLDWSTRIAARYVPAGQAESYGRRNAVPGEMLCRLRIERLARRARHRTLTPVALALSLVDTGPVRDRRGHRTFGPEAPSGQAPGLTERPVARPGESRYDHPAQDGREWSQMARRERKPKQKKHRLRRHFAPTRGRVFTIAAGLLIIAASFGVLWLTDQHRVSVAADGDCQQIPASGASHIGWNGSPGWVPVPADAAHGHPAAKLYVASTPPEAGLNVCWRGSEVVSVDYDGSSDWLASGLSGDALAVVGIIVIVFAFLIPMGPKGPKHPVPGEPAKVAA